MIRLPHSLMPAHLETKILVLGMLGLGGLLTQMNPSLSCSDSQTQASVTRTISNQMQIPAHALSLTNVRVVSDGWFDQRHECAADIATQNLRGPQAGTTYASVAYETLVSINGMNVVLTRRSN